MALKMTLEAKYNHMGIDFIDAYWKITSISYDIEAVYFKLQAYPNREASKKSGDFIEERLPIGGAEFSTFEPRLYSWGGATYIQDVFPNGIPLDPNQQKTAIYNWIKGYTELPFEDVFEEES